MAKLDLDEVQVVELTVKQARDMIDEDILEDLVNALDEAQAPVFNGSQEVSYVVLRISKGED